MQREVHEGEWGFRVSMQRFTDRQVCRAPMRKERRGEEVGEIGEVR